MVHCCYKAFTMVLVQHLFTAYYVPRTLLVTQAQHGYKKNTREPVALIWWGNHEKLIFFFFLIFSVYCWSGRRTTEEEERVRPRQTGTGKEVLWKRWSFFFEFYFIYFLYSKFLLVIHFIHISVYMSTPISQFITPPTPPPPFSPLGVNTWRGGL